MTKSVMSIKINSDLAPAYVRKFDKRLNRFTAFVNKQTGRRYIVEDQLDQLVDYVKKHSRDGYNSINIATLYSPTVIYFCIPSNGILLLFRIIFRVIPENLSIIPLVLLIIFMILFPTHHTKKGR